MKTTIALILAALAPLLSASALPEPEYPAGVTAKIITEPFEYPGTDGAPEWKRGALDKRANHGVYLCNDANFPPPPSYCVYITSSAGTCVPLGNDLEDKVSSVGPDQGAYCRFYFDRGCSDNSGSRHFDTTYPGVSDLSRYGDGKANDQISSYQCWDQ